VTFAGLVGRPPRFLDVRFDAAGRALRCSGNTVITRLGAGPAAEALMALRDRIAAAGGDRVLAFLPPSSYHMTVFDGVLHDVRAPDRWPEGLARDADARAADAFILDALRRARPAGRFRLRPRRLAIGDAGLGLLMDGADPAEEARLRHVRDELAALTGLTHRPDHAGYVFHVTLAYLVAPVPADVAPRLDAVCNDAGRDAIARLGEITLGPPEACLFDDMTAFRRQFVLGHGAEAAGP